jgi:DNA-binding NtrC family response regulator
MTILVIDDDSELRDLTVELLDRHGLSAVAVGEGLAALEFIRDHAVSVVVSDLVMPGLSGLDLIPRIAELNASIPIILQTGQGDVRSAVQAMRLGAYDYLEKPWDPDEFILTVQRALERRRLQDEIEALRRERVELLGRHLGSSPAMREIALRVDRIARTPLTVLIVGETGTGKEVVAREIHQQSLRRERPFIAVDCGAIPDTLIESELFGHEKGAFTGANQRKQGWFELADGGTLFLDEVGNLAPAAQSKLLRVIQEREVRMIGSTRSIVLDVRIIAASNTDFTAEIQAGRFRQDLYYRFGEFVLTLPPLRDRREDIPHLAARFLAEASAEFRHPVQGISDAALAVLRDYAWPGNVRELRNVVRRAVVLASDSITIEHLAPLGASAEAARSTPAPSKPAEGVRSLRDVAATAAEEAERQAIREALAITRGNRKNAAQLLQTDYKTLYLKMKRYGF